jgi:Uma2 family endonuclease
MITDISQLDISKTYSYVDYYTWGFDDRIKLFHGQIFEIGPSPGTRHQQISGNLVLYLGNILKRESHQLFMAPFDVRFIRTGNSIKDEDVYTVVQPDLCVVCDKNKLDTRGAIGAPDLMIAILSPGNSKKELFYKYELYQEAGVLEHWIVNPSDKILLIYVLKDGIFVGQPPLIEESKIKSPLFPKLDFTLSEIFN